MIALVGLMGSGKSTLGKLLARRLGVSFVDLDEVIVRRVGKTIPQIFSEDGEDAFRQLEADCLQEMCHAGNAIVLATGGGIVMRADNRQRLKHCTVIWLDAAPEVLAERISGDANRPLLQDVDALQRMRDLDRQRRPLYKSCADFRLETHHVSVVQAVDTLCQKLN